MASKGIKIGELARRTGLTVRALHYYDQIALVQPSIRTGSGHRLYTDADVARLQQVLSLRQLGFTLDQSRDLLDRPDFSPVELLGRHLAQLRERLAAQRELCDRVEGLVRILNTAGEVSADRLIQVIEGMTMIDKYYTPEQMDYLKKRAEEVGPEQIRSVEQEWPQLMAQMKARMESGADPASPEVQALARRWRELVEMFTGGDPGILASVTKLWKEQGSQLAAQHNLPFDAKLGDYVHRAHAAAGTAC